MQTEKLFFEILKELSPHAPVKCARMRKSITLLFQAFRVQPIAAHHQIHNEN